ncbi:MAG TPA: PIN domain-containing protein [Thermoanaerobaculia bacterium]|nr:PIN domain-containing protein [Thermoanaerobaculia bacterium]
MTAGYVDTSCLVAIAFGERGADRMIGRLVSSDRLLSSNLLEAELRSAVAREGISAGVDDLIGGVTWVFPDRSLTREFDTVLSAGYVRGADLWHLAVALFVDPKREIAFITLDQRQKRIARALGFPE